ncbi:MAG TPA: Clp protease ClpP [Paracoccaceae bacterium]|nr:Clp protease ClpP [Paracoccaceae bacterium]
MNEICLYGTVGESFWGEECFTPTQVREALAGMSGPVTVRINSGGGVAMDGQTIHNLLRDYPDQVRVVVDGIAASAASLIAMAGDTIAMRDGSIMMIHDPAWAWTEGRGTEEDHLRTAATLRLVADGYAQVYAARAGMPPGEARRIMKAETYLDGEGAVAAGFADEVEQGAAQQVAAFDYRIYAHAPQELLKAGAGVAPRKRAAVLAAMAGLGARNTGGIAMTKKVTVATDDDETMDGLTVEVETDEDEEEMPESEAAETEDEDMAAEGGGEDDEDEEETAARASAAQILDLCAALRRPLKEARAMIGRGLTLKQAAEQIAARQRKESAVSKIKPGIGARITRDERDTRKEGMAGALVARMSGAREVQGPARQYMTMSLVRMAAHLTGHRGYLDTPAERLDVLRLAMSGGMSTSDLPAILENALNKRLLDVYELAQPTYRAIADRMDFSDFRPHPVSAIGGWPGLRAVPESGEIQFGAMGDKKETVALVTYASGLRITRQMLVNDDLGAIEREVARAGEKVAADEDRLFYEMFLSGSNADGPTLAETSRQVFNTTDGTKAGTPAAITPASIALGYKALRERRDIPSGAPGAAGAPFLYLTPAVLLCGPTKEFEALQLLAPIQAAQASNVNPYAGKLQVVVCPWIAGNAWYMFAAPSARATFMYGYLQGEAGPRVRMDEPFGTLGMAWTIQEDFGFGAVDFRGGFKNAGA